MAFAPNVWSQLKNLTADELISALQRDGWTKDPASRDATISYIKYQSPKNKRVVIHYHPRKTYQPKLLRALLTDIGWTEADMRRLKLIR
jgi:predicted RNA binding protein YcfA (HicA-like mRNA interferase family)